MYYFPKVSNAILLSFLKGKMTHSSKGHNKHYIISNLHVFNIGVTAYQLEHKMDILLLWIRGLACSI